MHVMLPLLYLRVKIMSFENQQKIGLGKVWKYYGYNKASMARALDVTPQAINDWFRRGRVSAKKAIIIDGITGGQITKEELRPDVKEWFGV